MLKELHVNGYRSLRRIRMPLTATNVIVGPNGCGKSNLYRALFLLSAAAEGNLAKTVADEGGLPSALWAGPRHKNEPAKVRIALEFDDDLRYEFVCGRMPMSERPKERFEGAISRISLTEFSNDLDIKRESVTTMNYKGKRISLVERVGQSVKVRDVDGRESQYPMAVSRNESVLSGIREPHRFPELASLRQTFLNWRFYHQFRLDADSPLRQPQIGILTPIMAHDGADLACALGTIMAMDGAPELFASFEEAFPGSALNVNTDEGQFSVEVATPGIFRDLSAVELSDGTLQYLCLLAALMSPQPPAFLAINEPETSLHIDLMDSLARLFVRASAKSQLWITTHSTELAAAIRKHSRTENIKLEKIEGETCIEGIQHGPDDEFEEDDEAAVSDDE
jgi:predicted ATPase